ncbi:MAG: LytR C-terminal domain-containing protein [Acidimicrobiales bacterium]
MARQSATSPLSQGPDNGRRAPSDSMVGNSARGIILLVVVLILGIFILNKSQTGGTAPASVSAGTRTTTTKAAKAAKGKGATTTTPSTRAIRQPAAIKVLAANGSGVSGLGSKVGDRLTAAGYNSLAPANATGQITASIVEFAPGFDLESLFVAQALGLPATSVKALAADIPVADTKGADIVVLVGPDLNTAATSTTVAGASATTPTTAFRVTTTTG